MLRSITLALALAVATPGVTQSLPQADVDSIVALEEGFTTSFMAGDLEAVINTSMPPRMMNMLAEQAGMSPDELRGLMLAQMGPLMEQFQVEEFSIDTTNLTPGETSIGRPYALAPTVTRATITGAGTMQMTSETLFLEDDGTWYMLRVEDPSQEQLLLMVYPDFEGVTFTPGTMTPVE